jgi:hypothetical protein
MELLGRSMWMVALYGLRIGYVDAQPVVAHRDAWVPVFVA